MTTGDRVQFQLITGSSLPANPDSNTLYFLKGSQELYLGQDKIGDAASASGSIAGKGAGYHNSIYRGNRLGTATTAAQAVTAAQWAAIQDGSFTDMFIGDYWTIGRYNWRIAAFDYYLGTGDEGHECTDHHVTLVPDTALGSSKMNNSADTTTGYANSLMRTSGLDSAKTTINNAFGAAHILKHRQFFTNASTSGHPSGGAWYDSTVDLMSEINVYGSYILGAVSNGPDVYETQTVDKTQYPLFRNDHCKERMSHDNFWLRDIVTASYFALATHGGYATFSYASGSSGVRPAFSIIG